MAAVDQVRQPFGDGLPTLRDIVLHDLAPRRALGQHFLLDPGICQRIVTCAGRLAGREVVEVGPGPGGLTRALLRTDIARLVAIEVDPRASSPIRELSQSDPRLELLVADATRLDLSTLVATPRQVVANLPYNVATPILISLLRAAASWEQLVVMLQREVAERVCAAPSSRTYGRLSVLCQWRCAPEIVMHVHPGAFTPPPKVWSSVVRLVPRPLSPDALVGERMEALTASAFGQRRKMLRSSLLQRGGIKLLERAGISPERRAETLSPSEFERLALMSLATFP